MFDFLEGHEMPYHLRKLIELTAMQHGLSKHVRTAAADADTDADADADADADTDTATDHVC